MDESIDNAIDREFARVTRLITVALVALVTLEIAVFVVVFAAFGVLLLGARPAHATNIVGGNIINQTWTPAGVGGCACHP